MINSFKERDSISLEVLFQMSVSEHLFIYWNYVLEVLIVVSEASGPLDMKDTKKGIQYRKIAVLSKYFIKLLVFEELVGLVT